MVKTNINRNSKKMSSGKALPKEETVPWYKTEVSLGKVKTTDIAMVSKHFAVMLNAGLSVPEALEVITEQSVGGLKKVLKRVNRRVQGGSAFADALKFESKTFDASFISAVEVGENSGTLDANLERLAKQMESDLSLKRNVQSAMIYPSVVLSMAVILGFGIAIFVLPQVSQIFESLNVELPITTKILIWVSNFFVDYGAIVVPASIGGTILFLWFSRRKAVRPLTDRVLLLTPVVGVFTSLINRARFCRTVGTLLQSGTAIEEALDITSRVMPNYVYEKSVRNMMKQVAGGSEFSTIIERYPDLYPKMIQRMVAVGERSASLGSTLEFLADYYEERVMVMSKNLSSILEPIMLLFIGGVVAVMAMSILTPIYSILSGV